MKITLLFVLLPIYVLSNPCSIPEWVSNALLETDRETETHTFTCPDGSVVRPRNGTETDVIVTRCVNGELIPNLAEHKCEPIRCPTLKNTSCYNFSWTGQGDGNDGPEVNTDVEILPNPGYFLIGTKELKCIRTKKFKARLKGTRPKCVKLCKQPRLPHGQIYDDEKNPIKHSELFPGKEYSLRCEKGYKIKKGTNRYFLCNNESKIRYKELKPRCVVRKSKNRSEQ